MPFVTIPSNAIDVGDPITKDLWDKVKGNLDDLDQRLTGTETSQNQIVLFDALYINSSSAVTITGIDDTNALQNVTLTDCYVQIYEKGSLTGALEIDVKVNSTPDDTGMVSVFSTKPKITLASASDFDKSTNQIFDGTKVDVTEGFNIRLDVTEMPGSGVLGKFRVVLVGEVT